MSYKNLFRLAFSAFLILIVIVCIQAYSNTGLRADVAALQAEVVSLQNNDDAHSARTQPAAPPSSSRTVYVTDSGEKHHASGCRYLINSENAIDYEKAISQGYTACSVCGGG